ncbi:MAG: phospho-N-acetylmuramoyl-pentapeptide-transferase [Clostridia bacterium]|nr:phospho-N-acetylmuramoyl-pentapeptide-transferase [Clostridia bacterium]
MSDTVKAVIIAACGASAAFALTVVILRVLIPFLRSKKIGQKISEIGPRWHKGKEGTPIMGGLAFIIAITAVSAALAVFFAATRDFSRMKGVLITLAMALLNGLVGFIDDYTKLIKKQNEGLLPWQKLLFQFAISAGYVAAMRAAGLLETSLYFPFFGTSAELGFFFYPLAVLLTVGIVNAVNLTDGIDGLASSVSGIYGLLFTFIGAVSGDIPLAALSASVFGGTSGFLVYNFYPARILMGDTGSLFLGGTVAGLAFLIGNPLIMLLAGIVFVIEAASVILQVGYFKITHGKRLFKMAPIHHHFEKCGWSEIKIVAVFSAVALLAAVLSWFGR